jgi:hypothetical protein
MKGSIIINNVDFELTESEKDKIFKEKLEKYEIDILLLEVEKKWKQSRGVPVDADVFVREKYWQVWEDHGNHYSGWATPNNPVEVTEHDKVVMKLFKTLKNEINKLPF